ncbi:MAG: Coenzyme F420 hydrogenase/dehydrogenase, beta subunit C-terminal domain [Alphaproteobacteria bacterium]
MRRRPGLGDLVAGGLCAGCGLCAALAGPAVEMRLTKRGFARPATRAAVPTGTLDRILAACPAVAVEGPDPDHATDTVWGPVQVLRRAWAVDPAVRFAGASGGVVTALAGHLLTTGAVDAVLHAGGGERPLETVGRVSRNVAALLAHAGSRYAPSPVLAGLAAALAEAERIAVIGKPCEIAALRRLVRDDPSLTARIPWMLSFFCAGVPSQAGTEILLRRMGIAPERLRHLRYRGMGWPGRMTAEAEDGRIAAMSYTDSWGGELHRHLQFRCKICPDGTGEQADIAAADAWITPSGYPDFAERDGVSAVIARSGRGRALLAEAEAAGVLATAPLAVVELAAMQPYQLRRKQTVAVRVAALRLLGGRAPRYRRLRLARNALGGWRRLLRDFAGTALRVLQGRHRE